MNGNLLYEMAQQRIADHQRAARTASLARTARAAAREQRAKATAAERIAMPVIPDFPAEMFESAQGTVPAPREEETGGRPARSGH